MLPQEFERDDFEITPELLANFSTSDDDGFYDSYESEPTYEGVPSWDEVWDYAKQNSITFSVNSGKGHMQLSQLMVKRATSASNRAGSSRQAASLLR